MNITNLLVNRELFVDYTHPDRKWDVLILI
jgi:hypothetical protein